jgi:hypothetical protein
VVQVVRQGLLPTMVLVVFLAELQHLVLFYPLLVVVVELVVLRLITLVEVEAALRLWDK